MAHLQFLRILRQHQPDELDMVGRASGHVICDKCGLELYEHLACLPDRDEHDGAVIALVGLAVDCDGKAWKL